MAGTAAPAGALSVNLDRDAHMERLVQIRAHYAFPAARVRATAWAVRDRVGGRTVTRRLTRAQEHWLPPRLGDRNANGLREILFGGASGNSLFDTRIVEWNGRRARTLWVQPHSGRFWERALPPDRHIIGTSAPRFPQGAGGGARDIEVDGYEVICRACEPRSVYTARWKWSPVRGRWVLTAIDGPHPPRESALRLRARAGMLGR